MLSTAACRSLVEPKLGILRKLMRDERREVPSGFEPYMVIHVWVRDYWPDLFEEWTHSERNLMGFLAWKIRATKYGPLIASFDNAVERYRKWRYDEAKRVSDEINRPRKIEFDDTGSDLFQITQVAAGKKPPQLN
jgi:hypothetical protein